MSVSRPKVGSDQGRGPIIGFCHDLQSADEDDDGEIEPGSCEQSADTNDKRSRRYTLLL